MLWPRLKVFLIAFSALSISSSAVAGGAKNKQASSSAFAQDMDYQTYLDFFEEVYGTMEQNYYIPIKRASYDKFIEKFNDKIYSQVKSEGKSSDYVKWRSAAYLIDYLKSSEDIFSAFYPPKPAKEYEQTALGKEISLGIEGQLIKEGFAVIRVEPRSDSYVKGLRPKDIILAIDGTDVVTLAEDEIKKRLIPLENAKVVLKFLAATDQTEQTIEVISQEFFEQTVFLAPVDIPGIFCFELRKFNRKTSEDMFNFLSFIKQHGPIRGLILDLRGNPGGPPLAAREISAFFLTPNQEFAYFQKRNEPKAVLDVPQIPDQYRYSGPIVILTNKESGSASELFSGVMQKEKRAVIMGTNTAGQVLLKSMFHFKDESMVLLVTGRGYFPDGSVFSFNGVRPDKQLDLDKAELVRVAALFLASQKKN